jgi:hypothetical protein
MKQTEQAKSGGNSNFVGDENNCLFINMNLVDIQVAS